MTVLHIGFRLAGAEYVVPAAQVLHLETFEGATPIPGAAPYVAGLVQVRGRLVPVIDLRVRFGIPGAPPEGIDRRVIVLQLPGRSAGLLVDSAREVLKIAPAAFQPPPELVAEQSPGFVKAVATLGTRLVLLVDVTQILGTGVPGQELSHG